LAERIFNHRDTVAKKFSEQTIGAAHEKFPNRSPQSRSVSPTISDAVKQFPLPRPPDVTLDRFAFTRQ
jgi:hypothetical protein